MSSHFSLITAAAAQRKIRWIVIIFLAIFAIARIVILNTTSSPSEGLYYLDAVLALASNTLCAFSLLHYMLWILLVCLDKYQQSPTDFPLPSFKSEWWIIGTDIVLASVSYYLVVQNTPGRTLQASVLAVSKVLLPAAAISAPLIVASAKCLWVSRNVILGSNKESLIYIWLPGTRPGVYGHTGLVIINAYTIFVALALSNLESPFEPDLLSIYALNNTACIALRSVAGFATLAHAFLLGSIAFDRTRSCRESKGASAIVDYDVECGEYIRGVEEIAWITYSEYLEKENEQFEDA